MVETPRLPHPVVIGLLGGIAAGKSTVAARFAAHGFVTLDADHEAKLVTEERPVLAAIRTRFGAELVHDGKLDRKALAAKVFADSAARADLEALIHPVVRTRLTQKLDAAGAAGRNVVLDVPLLLEGGLIARCDVCVFVDATEATRMARARARGWQAEELLRRERAQADLAVKRARCAHTISTDGSLDDLRAHVDALFRQLGV